jgi:hypothetical protein
MLVITRRSRGGRGFPLEITGFFAGTDRIVDRVFGQLRP